MAEVALSHGTRRSKAESGVSQGMFVPNKTAGACHPSWNEATDSLRPVRALRLQGVQSLPQSVYVNGHPGHPGGPYLHAGVAAPFLHEHQRPGPARTPHRRAVPLLNHLATGQNGYLVGLYVA